mmetsp:Transcript_149904/g.417674  ORF Transcript_149904/g.417674 Transcript_149904/m.417674 type:complete len:228 (-) Transcript_149904:2-685(-)
MCPSCAKTFFLSSKLAPALRSRPTPKPLASPTGTRLMMSVWHRKSLLGLPSSCVKEPEAQRRTSTPMLLAKVSWTPVMPPVRTTTLLDRFLAKCFARDFTMSSLSGSWKLVPPRTQTRGPGGSCCARSWQTSSSDRTGAAGSGADPELEASEAPAADVPPLRWLRDGASGAYRTASPASARPKTPSRPQTQSTGMAAHAAASQAAGARAPRARPHGEGGKGKQGRTP